MTEFRKMLLSLDGNEDFGKVVESLNATEFYYDDDQGCCLNICDIDDISDILPDDYYLDSSFGATKVVAILRHMVLKKTYAGYTYTDIENEYEYHEYDRENSDFDNYSPDYCEIESKVYEAAQEEGIADFFAETCHVCGDVYAQPRFEQNADWYLLEEIGSELTLRDVNEIKRDYQLNIPTVVAAQWFEIYSSEQLMKLSDFLFRHHINDLHGGNAAMFKDGVFRLIDYSGYNSGTENTLE